jgi:hypothetical protein
MKQIVPWHLWLNVKLSLWIDLCTEAKDLNTNVLVDKIEFPRGLRGARSRRRQSRIKGLTSKCAVAALESA